ncbi:MAG: hypothetical protein K6L76_12110 [Agarilytica sp.]
MIIRNQISRTRLAGRTFAAIAVLAITMECANADEYLYRYKNHDGVKVINHTIPAEFVQGGYDILSTSGQLIRHVQPAPSDGQIAEATKRRMLRQKYDVLRRRYANPNDIESAKKRRLENLDTNIEILRGNINTLNNQIEGFMSQAAAAEREGRSVPANLLRQLKDTRTELELAEVLLDTRMQEYRAVAERFDKDLATFIEGSKLVATEKVN